MKTFELKLEEIVFINEVIEEALKSIELQNDFFSPNTTKEELEELKKLCNEEITTLSTRQHNLFMILVNKKANELNLMAKVGFKMVEELSTSR